MAIASFLEAFLEFSTVVEGLDAALKVVVDEAEEFGTLPDILPALQDSIHHFFVRLEKAAGHLPKSVEGEAAELDTKGESGDGVARALLESGIEGPKLRVKAARRLVGRQLRRVLNTTLTGAGVPTGTATIGAVYLVAAPDTAATAASAAANTASRAHAGPLAEQTTHLV